MVATRRSMASIKKEFTLLEDTKPGIMSGKRSRSVSTDSTSTPPVRTPPQSPKRTKVLGPLAKPVREPPRWREQYERIVEQRKAVLAPVDTMGCHVDGEELMDEEAEAKRKMGQPYRLSTLVSLMLSSQTKDEITHEATQNLKRGLEGGLTLQALAECDAGVLDSLIRKVGFHNTKTKNLKKMAERVLQEHGGVVPEDLDSLLAIDGVGPKMAFLFMSAIGQHLGIGVDTHVHRITNRLGWHRPPTKTPEQTRVNLESWLPHELYDKINYMLVGFGQTICRPVKPLCAECNVGKGLCPSYMKKKLDW